MVGYNIREVGKLVRAVNILECGSRGWTDRVYVDKTKFGHSIKFSGWTFEDYNKCANALRKLGIYCKVSTRLSYDSWARGPYHVTRLWVYQAS